ncbi:alpha/beta fold hydrolase [Modestobacter sp. VKM Ac-2978]|uniref:alpha/beta fold hydrolase n=1 Tax=Modestobacter sp. VKM Ac-2978 TaxID=3004132 RepID=UPI0022AB44EE|nr:alpha/beta hydrolase [Modestobacter sp. VKM Ac-2978]MCZ2849874.1 alpha/beta hydrolase [Modestobacter sp. VKM Ac-2978]
MTEDAKWAFYTEPSTIDVRGAQVAYRRAGQGEPVVYFHGAGLTRRWLPFYEALSQSTDLLVPEHPGFGDTPMPKWLESFDDLVLHYADLLDAFGLERVHLVGHSFGGWIAAEFASFFPERLRSLQLVAPAGLKGAFLHDPFRQEGHEALERVFNGAADRFPEYLEGGEPVEETVQDYKELTGLARFAWNPRYDRKLDRRLGRVAVPTQIVLPDDDRVIDKSVAARYAELIPGAKVVDIPGSSVPTSHVPFVQEPTALASLLSDFVHSI